MKLSEIIERLNRSEYNKGDICIGEFAESFFNLSFYDYTISKRLVYYYIGEWKCTDTPVGYRAYFLDDTLVAVSSQEARKSDEKIEWVSREEFEKVRRYIFSYDNTIDIKILDMDEEAGEGYRISFCEQLNTYHKDNAIYKGELVKIIDNKKSEHIIINNIPKYVKETVKIRLPDNSELWVEMKELLFKYNIV
jgi:hypothetical protein